MPQTWSFPATLRFNKFSFLFFWLMWKKWSVVIDIIDDPSYVNRDYKMPGLKKITTFLHNFSFRRYRFNRIKKHHLLSWRVSFERNSLWKTLLSFCSLYGIIKIKDKIFQKKAIILKYYIGLWPSPIDFVVFFLENHTIPMGQMYTIDFCIL